MLNTKKHLPKWRVIVNQVKDALEQGYKCRKGAGVVVCQCRGCARVITVALKVQLREKAIRNALEHLERCPQA